MKDLVTDAAIDAACRSYQDHNESIPTGISDALSAAAKFIAAEALRQAASELLAFKGGHDHDSGYLRAIETALTYLGSRADELERGQ